MEREAKTILQANFPKLLNERKLLSFAFLLFRNMFYGSAFSAYNRADSCKIENKYLRRFFNSFVHLFETPTEKRKGFLLLILWCSSIYIFERALYQYNVSTCSISVLENNQTDFQTTRLIIISDPQLTDGYSYWYAPKSSYFLWLLESRSDYYMRRSFQAIQG